MSGIEGGPDGMTWGRTLLVEDDLGLSEALKMALRELAVPFEHVTTLADARRRFDRSAHEFILLDRALPDGDGLDFCRELRKGGYRGAILMLTAKGEVHERVRGLTGGADDYLAKPFSWDELKARMIALARRYRPVSAPSGASDGAGADGAVAAPEGVQAGLWAREPEKLRILGPNGWVKLTPLEYKLVAFLMDAEGAIVGRNELLRQVWGYQILPKTRTVDYFMARIRKHFETDPESPRHFLTVRGAGYSFDSSGSNGAD